LSHIKLKFFEKNNFQKFISESPDIDLDSLLQELCALENQLNSSNSTALPQFASSSSSNTRNGLTILNCSDTSAPSDKSNTTVKFMTAPSFQQKQDLTTPTNSDFLLAPPMTSQDSVSVRLYDDLIKCILSSVKNKILFS